MFKNLKRKKERKIRSYIEKKLKQTNKLNKRMKNTNQEEKAKRSFDFNCQFLK